MHVAAGLGVGSRGVRRKGQVEVGVVTSAVPPELDPLPGRGGALQDAGPVPLQLHGRQLAGMVLPRGSRVHPIPDIAGDGREQCPGPARVGRCLDEGRV